ncbi:hypothetical protein NUW54_g10163 [Trametes sanguinea]|uniref:Uncharacterized protein n=1 Tax=Trametes sanguinea TaxID=158606 RepID=A0ACC1P160_9APHY|nr:hypothetical protein NUW54_g10163 [Trametes sanguinea]
MLSKRSAAPRTSTASCNASNIAVAPSLARNQFSARTSSPSLAIAAPTLVACLNQATTTRSSTGDRVARSPKSVPSSGPLESPAHSSPTSANAPGHLLASRAKVRPSSGALNKLQHRRTQARSRLVSRPSSD